MHIIIFQILTYYYRNLLTLLTLSTLCYNCIAEDVEEKVTNDADWLSFSHSPVDLHYLAVIEESLINVVKEYVAKLEGEPEVFFRRYIADYDDSSLPAYENWIEASNKKRSHVIHTNPLLAHRMLWRYVKCFPKIKNVLMTSDNDNILKNLSGTFFEPMFIWRYATDFPKIKNVSMTSDNGNLLKNLSQNILDPMFIWPSEKDLNDSMNNLLNLHFTYNLNISEFSEGNVSGVVTNASLAAIHCFEIAQFAFRQNNRYTLAIDWLEVADMKWRNPSGHPILDFLDEESIVLLLEEIILAHDEVWEQEPPGFHNLFQYYNRIDSKKAMRTRLSVLQREYTTKGDGVNNLSLNDITAYSTLCKGGNLQSEKEKSKLYCWYESKIHPAFYIIPQKMELHSEDPYVFQVYDFIGNEMINYLKKKAIPLMERSKTSKQGVEDLPSEDELENESHREYSQFRTSMYSWLEDEVNYMELKHLSQKIGRLPGLRGSNGPNSFSTNYQVAIYATGGHYNVHIDWSEETGDLQVNDQRIGDRLATFMIYLNNVELGGHTAFTSVGVGIPPVKGSAIFWYNSMHNGKVDYRTWHAGCPVLLGEKWVANKWIYRKFNFKSKLHIK